MKFKNIMDFNCLNSLLLKYLASKLLETYFCAALYVRVTESMLKFESGLPCGRFVINSITDGNPKIWWRSNKLCS